MYVCASIFAMTDKILSTFLTRTVTMMIMFIVVIVNANTFGAEGTGTIALIILALTILQVLSEFVGSSTLVYLTPQRDNFQLLVLSYTWALISNGAGLFILHALHLLPSGHILQLTILTIIYSIYNIHVRIMQGKEDIKLFNLLQLSQAVLLIVCLISFLGICKLKEISPTIDLYVYAFIISYFIPAVATCFYIGKKVRRTNFNRIGSLLKEMFSLGFWTQLANLAQILTYRINYYIIESFVGRKPLGVYELGTRISEAVWIFPKSICLVQYARISNNHEDNYARTLTLSLLKIVFVFSLTAILVLAVLPSSFIAWIFGPEFAQSKPVINSLLPGILFLGCMSILSHYFSGYGKYWVNAVGSIISLIVTAGLGFTLIPTAKKVSTLLALQTAGWISSMAYFASFLFTLCIFVKHTHAQGRDFLITKQDCLLFKQIISEKIPFLTHTEK